MIRNQHASVLPGLGGEPCTASSQQRSCLTAIRRCYPQFADRVNAGIQSFSIIDSSCAVLYCSAMHAARLRENSAPRAHRGRLLLISIGLLLAIAGLGLVQWTTAFRGDLLWIAGIALSLLLVGTLLGIVRGAPRTKREAEEYENSWKRLSGLPWNRPSWHDPSDIGSPLRRDD